MKIIIDITQDDIDFYSTWDTARDYNNTPLGRAVVRAIHEYYKTLDPIMLTVGNIHHLVGTNDPENLKSNLYYGVRLYDLPGELKYWLQRYLNKLKVKPIHSELYIGGWVNDYLPYTLYGWEGYKA